ITFSTKDRQPFITEDIQDELFHYLGGICRNLAFYPVIVGGHKDHVHILCLLSGKMLLIKFMEQLKSQSSKWMKTKGKAFKNFYWQRGYGSFSVNPTDIETVKKYIINQPEHHKIWTFKEEFLAFLEKNNIPYDERYIWD
ncbi:MAG: IS200/IS605 family transposase, partial [Bacteroidales bacterium]|nr:IS200/IS605 family transposase [Bacteroidales bacterium]